VVAFTQLPRRLLRDVCRVVTFGLDFQVPHRAVGGISPPDLSLSARTAAIVRHQKPRRANLARWMWRGRSSSLERIRRSLRSQTGFQMLVRRWHCEYRRSLLLVASRSPESGGRESRRALPVPERPCLRREPCASVDLQRPPLLATQLKGHTQS